MTSGQTKPHPGYPGWCRWSLGEVQSPLRCGEDIRPQQDRARRRTCSKGVLYRHVNVTNNNNSLLYNSVTTHRERHAIFEWAKAAFS